MLRRALVASLVFAAAVSVSTSAFAQKNAAPKGTTILLDATVEQVVPQGIIAVDAKGKKYAVGFDAKSKVGIKGETAFENVSNGTYVQFDVNLNEKGEPDGPVKKIQITTQSDIARPGIFSSKGPDGKLGEAGPFFVRGTVRSNKDGKLTVVADKQTMTVEVAEGVTVPVTLADWRMAKKDDKIKGNGTAYTPPPGAPYTPVLGTLMEITAAQPITKGK